jgi:hypothetical protein
LGRFGFILRARLLIHQNERRIEPGGVDAEDTSLYIGFTSARTGSGKFSGMRFVRAIERGL